MQKSLHIHTHKHTHLLQTFDLFMQFCFYFMFHFILPLAAGNRLLCCAMLCCIAASIIVYYQQACLNALHICVSVFPYGLMNCLLVRVCMSLVHSHILLWPLFKYGLGVISSSLFHVSFLLKVIS